MKYLATAAFLALSVPVYAEDVKCAPTEDVYALLEEKYGEARQMWAQNGPEQVVEFWGSGKGWTLFITLNDGRSCLVAEGTDWGVVPQL